ncbi:multidrug transporter [Xylogone sp. PMI_703]|nr:multidrug transporter [Xylogone sp. PMI_703]
MLDTVREAPFGQLVRYITGNRYFRYPEETPGFKIPEGYRNERSNTSPEPEEDVGQEKQEDASQRSDPQTGSPTSESSEDLERQVTRTISNERHVLSLQRTRTLPYTNERLQVERSLEAERTLSRPIAPIKTTDGLILVDWYTTDDPANSQNWSSAKKAMVATLICLYTFAVYASSSIYVPSVPLVMKQFGIEEFKASLPLALYVLGYGTGPLLFSPMSEIPLFGRNVPYVATFALYLAIAAPTAVLNNFGALVFFRFLQGFFGSPCLANGGATMQDMYSLLYLPYPIALWVASAFAGPAVGPVLSGFTVVAEDWHWSLWIILWLSAPVFVAWFFFLPETSASNILLRRAMRLRKLTGNNNIRSQTEIDRQHLTFKDTFVEAIIKPVEIMIKDPAVLFTNVYTALIYGIYYSFFEAFPLVYGPLYGMNIGQTSLIFLCILVGCFIGIASYFSYLNWFLIPDILKNGLQVQEWRLRPAIFGVIANTAGLFIFAWTSRTSIHWIVSVIGITIYAWGCYIFYQCIFSYIPMSYPQYAASLFAGNDFCRAMFAFGAVLFSRSMFVDLGIGKGVSLLGGLSVVGIIGWFVLYFYGARLRAKSKFALS